MSVEKVCGVEVFTLALPYTSPPLSMNDRKHYMARARLTRQIRSTTAWLAKQQKGPTGLELAAVCLHYRPRDNRRRDSDNLMPVLKAACDGLVDHGLVPDDTPQFMTKAMPVIHPAEKGSEGSLWLTISIGDSQ
ncbi:hypothetical protein [Rhodococcus sp. p52]|uniref:hypothetical protein n=1 Tax=Rhodococcus sp. p52 TaxID=935199 RepID=UPI001E2F782F|nr:hypothetical protein [Rhodococcus sp. p52]